MTAYPHRYNDTDAGLEHYATACVASARVLRREGHPGEAADLEAEAHLARTALNQHHEPPNPPDSGLEPSPLLDSRPGVDDEDVPRWWR